MIDPYLATVVLICIIGMMLFLHAAYQVPSVVPPVPAKGEVFHPKIFGSIYSGNGQYTQTLSFGLGLHTNSNYIVWVYLNGQWINEYNQKFPGHKTIGYNDYGLQPGRGLQVTLWLSPKMTVKKDWPSHDKFRVAIEILSGK